MDDTRSRFLERVDRVLAGGGLGRLLRAAEAGHAGMPRDASLMEQPRLLLGLEGAVQFECRGRTGAGAVELAPRDGLFVGPGRWVRARVRQPYVSMGAVFYPDSTRFYLMRGGPDRGGRPRLPVETYVVPAGLDEDGRAVARILAGTAPAVAEERYFHHAAECLLVIARQLLARPAGATSGGKARFTWQAACDFVIEHLHRPLSRTDVAQHVGVHPNHLSRLFAEFGRESFGVYLQARRLERARLLMADPRLNIAQVALLSGFGSANYFSRVFRARTGRTPGRERAEGLKG